MNANVPSAGRLQVSSTLTDPIERAMFASDIPPAAYELKEPTLGWACAFLGCNALRIWEGGQASFRLPICPRCDVPIARLTPDCAASQRVIDENLF